MADDSSEKVTAAAAAVTDELVAEAIAATKRPKGVEAPHEAVRQALRRRAAGETYTAIGGDIAEAIGAANGAAAAKLVSRWCKAAEAAGTGYVAGGRKTRQARPVRRSPVIAARLSMPVYDRVVARARKRDESLTATVERLVSRGLDREPPDIDPEQALAAERRTQLAEELARVSAEIQNMRRPVYGIGSNLNQLARFVNSRREQPENLVGLLTKIARDQEAVLETMTSLEAATVALVEKG